MLTESERAARGLSPAVNDGDSLFALLAARARRASDGALVTSCAVSLAACVAIVLFASSWWRLVPPLISVAAFGAWGIADRSRGADALPSRALSAVKMLATLVGSLAAIATALVVTAAMIGKLIS